MRRINGPQLGLHELHLRHLEEEVLECRPGEENMAQCINKQLQNVDLFMLKKTTVTTTLSEL